MNSIQKRCHFYNSDVSLKFFENKRFLKEGVGREGQKAVGVGSRQFSSQCLGSGSGAGASRGCSD